MEGTYVSNNHLQRMRDLAVRSVNGSLTAGSAT